MTTMLLRRRAFLQVAFCALAAGAILGPEVANAIEMAPPDKYTQVFVLARCIAAATMRFKDARVSYQDNNGKPMTPVETGANPDFVAIQRDANTMFDLFNREFECVKTAEILYAVKDVMEGRTGHAVLIWSYQPSKPDYTGLIFDAENEPYARQMLETVFTVAVARDLVRNSHTPLVAKMIPAFEKYVENYRDVLVC